MLPVQRKTRAQGGNRRSHQALKKRHAVECPNCRSPKLPHAACSECGYVRKGLMLKLSKDE